MRRSVRTLLVGVAAGATTVTGLAFSPVTADAAVTRSTPVATALSSRPVASPTPARARTVTLVTGDQVTVRTVAGRTTYAVRAARESGPGAALRRVHLGSRDYLIPVVAQAYLGSTLDPALFDLGTVAAAPASRVAVRIEHSGARPALPGVTVTADSSGVASGYLTQASARAFGDALTRQWVADRKAGHAQSSGLFAGIRRIRTATPPPATVTPMFPMHTLVIRGVDLAGKPMQGAMGMLMNVDDGRRYAGFVVIEDGEARVSLPAGRYSGVFDWAGLSSSQQVRVRTIPVAQLEVTGSGQRLTLDARQATAAPTISTPRPVGRSGDETFTYTRTDAAGYAGFSSADGLEPGMDFKIKPTPAATVGRQGFLASYHLAAPGASPSYTYDLSFSADRVRADQSRRVTAAQVATVNARYDTDQAGREALFGRYAVDPSSGFAFFSLYPVPVPSRRTEYVYGPGVPLWGEVEVGNELSDDPAFIDGAQPYPAGSTRSRAWRHGALGAGIPTGELTAAFCRACRAGNSLALGLAPFTDSSPDHVGGIFTSPDGSPVTHFTLSSGRTVLVDQDDALGAAVTVPAGAATYQAVLDVDRSWSGTTKSTRSHTELTFSSAGGAGPTAPRGWFCGEDPRQTCRVLPVLQARVDLPTSGTGTLPAGTSTIDVVAARVQGAAPAAVRSASLELRPAGFDYAAFPLKDMGNGRYRVSVDLPDFLGARDFDVRFSAKDAGGSTFTQTVGRAFTLAPAGARASSAVGTSPAARTSRPAGRSEAAAAAARSGPWARSIHQACSSAPRGGASCLARWRSGAGAGQLARVSSATRHSVGAPDLGFGPADLAAAYRLDPSRGAGQTIAIVDAYDNPRVEADLNVYRKAWGLPACTTANGCFHKVNQRGGSKAPDADPGWGVEIALDVQAVSAACPRCRILLVEADSESLEDIGTAVNRAVAMGATVVSNSYGAPEFGRTAALGRKYYTHPGVAIVASSGDDGFQAASFPAVWGSAIAVGGTTLSHSGSSWVERVWEGAGSGCSAYVAKPSWQIDRHCEMRTTSDVSAVADPATGLAVYDTFGLGADNGWIVVGGTSLSAPLVAGMIGTAGNAARLDTARWLYTHRGGLKDVTGGSNGYCGGDYLCTGTKGYDGPSGLGSPRGVSAL